jgi:hypothetical protein
MTQPSHSSLRFNWVTLRCSWKRWKSWSTTPTDGREHSAALRGFALDHPYWDMAILQVDGLRPHHPILELSLEDARQLTDTPRGHFNHLDPIDRVPQTPLAEFLETHARLAAP